MTMRNTIGWVRHGVTEWNLLGKIQGATDTPLSEEGLYQAGLLAERLAGESKRWDGVATSDLQRAATTGQVIADRLGVPLLKDARLRERSFGIAEGTTLQERLDRWGEEWRSLVPDQETNASLIERGQAFVEELVATRPGESWLVVTHGSFLATIIPSLIGETPEGYIQNVSLTILEQTEEGWKSLLHNCTVHLEAATS